MGFVYKGECDESSLPILNQNISCGTRGAGEPASLSTLLCYPYCSQIASCAQISTWQLVWGSEKSPRWGIAWFSCPAVPQHWEMAHKPIRCKSPWVQTQGQREYPEQTLQGSDDRDIEQPEWAKRAWRYIYFWKVFQADCISRALEWITPGILSQGWKFCSVLMAFTLPILLTELLHWTKGNFTACRVWDSGMVFCNENNILFSSSKGILL